MFNKYGFDKNETLTNLINVNGFEKVASGLEKDGVLVFINPKGGNKARIIATWNFFKELKLMNSTSTLAEYAGSIGAELKATCLADMPVMKKKVSDGKSFFGGLGWVTEWLEVKDPNGGVNKTGLWPASVQKLSDGSLIVVVS